MNTAPASSLAQQKASLWTGTSAQVYAVLDATQVPGLLERLQSPEVGDWDCLQRGALSPEEAAQAAYLVKLDPQSTFTDWLLTEASAALDHWGVLVVCDQGLRPMREHLRQMGEALTPAGERFELRWYDRSILRALLPTFSRNQLQGFFGTYIQAIVMPEASQWTWYRESVGQLMTDTRQLAG